MFFFFFFFFFLLFNKYYSLFSELDSVKCSKNQFVNTLYEDKDLKFIIMIIKYISILIFINFVLNINLLE